MILDKYINKEVFVVADSEEEDNGNIYIAEDWNTLIEHLADMNPSVEGDTRVFHGILTLAEFLPASFRGKSAFVVCLNHDDPTEGCCIESDSDTPENLSKELTEVLDAGGPIKSTTCDIDDFYILYGYQIETCISVNTDTIDEEAIDTCKKISDETELIGKNARLNFKTQEGV